MTKYIIDSHAHLDDSRFDEDRVDLIERFEKDDVYAMINPAFDLDSSKRSIDLSNNNEKIFAMVGTHPHDAKDYNEEVEKQYIELSKNPKVVAVGEIGLDYYYDNSEREVQRDVFIRQIELARTLDLPIVIHSRDAVEDTYKILSEHAKDMKVLLHAFSESWEVCERYLKLGYKIALGGVVTFKNARKLLEVAEKVPLENLLLETDSPYLTPHPHRGKRNEPSYTHFVAEKIAELKGIPVEEVRQHALKNTFEFFELEKYGLTNPLSKE
ncbi:MAG: TatD family hydrolase [Tissierellia bacterium]|nr:TatD family hydrolase [Tissierellia bacterium]